MRAWYLALELCQGTLHQYIAESRDISRLKGVPRVNIKRKKISDNDLVNVVRGVISGVRQLHELNVVHRDLKPRNILLDSNDLPKIADMGLGKKLAKHRSSFDSRVCGSVGWQPPEMITIRSMEEDEDNDDSNDEVDSGVRTAGAFGGRRIEAIMEDRGGVFAAGCITYYVLTRGKHPFGSEPEREYNIVHNRPNLSALDGFPLAQELVKAMIAHSPNDRISAADAESHPLFWDESKKLAFLQDTSDRVVKINSFALCSLMEAGANSVVGRHWDRKLDPELISDLGRYRHYNFTSVCDCLRVIRNKKNHYLDLPAKAKTILGAIPGPFFRYFDARFPRLLIHSYVSMASFYMSMGPRKREDRIKVPKEDAKGGGGTTPTVDIDFETFSRRNNPKKKHANSPIVPL
eukprot:jgi/Bigna1/80174/fgenesh1_pg.68_\